MSQCEFPGCSNAAEEDSGFLVVTTDHRPACARHDGGSDRRGLVLADLQRLLSDVQVRDVLELRCEDGTWTANLDLECPSCKGPAQTAWVEAATLPDMLVALVRSVKEHRERLAAECAGEGHR